LKNAPLSALVLFGIAGLVGGVVWIAADQERIEGDAASVPTATVSTPTVVQVTPREKKLQWKLEQAQRKLDKYKKDGVVLPNGAIRVKDVDGSPLYVYPELVEGVDRYGEPKFLMATYKRRDPVPFVKEPRQAPKNARAHIKRAPKGTVKFAEKPTPGAGANTGDDEGEAGSGKSSDKPNKPAGG